MTSSTISVIFFVMAALSTSARKIFLHGSINFSLHGTKCLDLFSSSLQTETRSEESLVMRVFNPDYHPSDDEMLAILREADLESHGYTKELTTTLTSNQFLETIIAKSSLKISSLNVTGFFKLSFCCSNYCPS